MDKKHNIGTEIDLEVVDLSGTKNNDTEIANESHDILHDNFYEGKTNIANEIHDVLCKNSDEGNITIDNERHHTLQNESDEGSTSIAQDFEEAEEMEISNNVATNDSNSDYLFENNSSQES